MPIVYGQPNCQPCKATTRKLDRLGIQYLYRDVSEDQEAREEVIALGFQQTPVVVVGDESWSGYRPDRLTDLVTSYFSLGGDD